MRVNFANAGTPTPGGGIIGVFSFDLPFTVPAFHAYGPVNMIVASSIVNVPVSLTHSITNNQMTVNYALQAALFPTIPTSADIFMSIQMIL